jgi:hypothetical protein
MSELELGADRQALTLFGDATPHVIVARATAIADVIAPLIRDRQLVKRIHQSEHVYLEGWTLAGTMLGVFATTARTWEIGDDDGYGATAEARTLAGALVGRADAVVMRNEEVGTDPKTGKPIRKWERAPAFQLLSMAQTRASSKALRMPLGFVMKLAGYDTTPAEEMEAAAARGETVSGGKGVAPGWKDLAEQQRAHADLGELIQQRGLRDWVATWLESKGYERPLAKGQLRQLQRAIERETASSRPASDDGDPGRPAGANTSAPGHPPRPGADQTSSPGRADRRDENGEGSQESATTPGLDEHDSGGED